MTWAAPHIRDAEDRFWTSFVTVESCWEWTGAIGAERYGTFVANGKRMRAHRWAYEHFKGPIPEGLELDHLCHNPRCVNPDHLEAVTHRENLMRSNGVTAVNSRKTHCLRGHELSSAGIWVDKTGRRRCLACNREKCAERRKRAS